MTASTRFGSVRCWPAPGKVALAAALVLFAAIYGAVIFAPSGYAPATHDSDFYLYYFPMTEVAFDLLREGHLPVWNPYIYAGMPYLASIEVGVLYPPNWIHLLLSTERAFCLLYVFHLLLAAGGMWLYTRGRGLGIEAGIFAATAFALAAPTLLHFDMGMTSVIYSSSWIPLIFALVDRCLTRRSWPFACGLAVVLACQFLAGFPMFTLLLAFWLPAYLLTFGINWGHPLSRPNGAMLIRLAIPAVLAFGLILPQLLPTLHYLKNAYRAELSYSQAVHCCLPIWNLLTFLIPGLFGDERHCPYWGETYLFDADLFCGVSTVVLAAMSFFSKRFRELAFWSLSAIVILGVALGKYSFLYDLCYLFVPGVNRFRGMARLGIFGIFALVNLAAIGLDELLNREARRSRRLVLGIGSALSLALLIAGISLSMRSDSPAFWSKFFDAVRHSDAELTLSVPEQGRVEFVAKCFHSMLRSGIFSAGILLAVTLLLLAGARWNGFRRWTGAGLVMLLGIEIFMFQGRYVVLQETAPYRAIARAARQALPADSEVFRVAAYGRNPPIMPNRLLYGRLQGIGGHENFVLARYGQFLHLWAGIEPEWQTFLSVPDFHRLYDMLNVKYYFMPEDLVDRRSSDELLKRDVFEYGGHKFSMFRNVSVRPRVSLVYDAQRSRDFDQSCRLLQLLDRGGYESGSSVEGDPGIPLAMPEASQRQQDRATIIDYQPAKITVDVETASPALLLFRETYYPSWCARVDGKPAPLLPANLFMRAVPVTPGQHRVVISYVPKQFYIGCVFAGCSALILLLLLWRSRRQIAPAIILPAARE
jgi:hypothetical protein